MRLVAFSLLLTVLVPALEADAGTIVLPDVIVTSTGVRTASVEVQSGLDSTSSLGSYSTGAPLPAQTINLGDTIQATIRADTGKVFQLTPGYDYWLQLGLVWSGTSDITAPLTSPPTITVNGLQGVSFDPIPTDGPFPRSFGRIEDSRIRIEVATYTQPTAVVTFESITVEFAAPATATFDSLSVYHSLFMALTSLSYPFDNIDMTPYLALVDAPAGPAVPEPSSIALLGLGTAGFGIGQDRRRRQSTKSRKAAQPVWHCPSRNVRPMLPRSATFCGGLHLCLGFANRPRVVFDQRPGEREPAAAPFQVLDADVPPVLADDFLADCQAEPCPPGPLA